MKKRLIGMAMAAILAMTALTGCGTAEDTSSLDSLTFTYVTSPLNLPSIVEKEEGIFTKAFADDGIEVKYTLEGKTYTIKGFRRTGWDDDETWVEPITTPDDTSGSQP